MSLEKSKLLFRFGRFARLLRAQTRPYEESEAEKQE
jgi:hypothetical protein